MAFYMGVKALPGICRKLIENGMRPDMPAASIQWGTTTRQRTVAGTISDLPQRVADANLSPPAITIIGQVVQMRGILNWFEARPLFGQTVAVTRTRQQASNLSQRLEELGARVIEAPTIDLVAPSDQLAVDAAIAQAGEYDWVIFTSANGVSFTKQRLLATGHDCRAFGRARLAAIGDATAAAISDELCLKVDLCPESFIAEALAEALISKGEVSGQRFLLLRADIARAVLREKLEAAGAAEVRDVAVYETKTASALPPILLELIEQKQLHWVTFTSSSTARNFVALLGADYRAKLEGVKLASIGPVTTATMKELGLTPTIEAQVSNIDGLVAAIAASKET